MQAFLSSVGSFWKDHRWWWIGLGIAALALRLTWAPEAVEQWYSRGFFPRFRSLIDSVLSLVPFPTVYLWVLFLLYLGYRFVRRLRRTRAGGGRRIGQAVLSLMAFLSATIFLFLLMWGYNYKRLPVEHSLEIKPKPLSVGELREELDTITSLLLAARTAIPGALDTQGLSVVLSADLEIQMREALTQQLSAYGYPTSGKVQGRLLRPKGVLLRFSTAGVYLPWTGEGHIDAGLHPLQQPYVLAHELAHGYGFTDEGTCNFWAYLACTGSEDPLIRYLGYFGYWRTLASNYRRYEPEQYSHYFEQRIPAGVRADLRAIYTEMDKYPDILPKLRDKAYDTYLKSQGIQEGLKNYSRVIMLAYAWRKRQVSI